MRLIPLLMVGLAGCLPPAPVLQRPPAFQRGVALGLFGEPEAELDRGLTEIRGLSASDVSLVVTWVQDDVSASEVRADSGYTPSDELLRRMIRRAHQRGLRVLLFPILRLVHRTAAEWRGVIRPRDPAAWFASYAALTSRLARLAAEEHVEMLSIGSELASLEPLPEWRRLIAEVRGFYSGRLLYSANWDRYDRVPFWDAVDLFGVSAYFTVTGPEATVAAARRSWASVRAELTAFARRIGHPLVLTEVGYPSVRGAGAWPWNDFLEGADGAEDGETQRRLYEAFALAWSDEPSLAGVYFWFWQGRGGTGDRSYSFRRKPAELVVRDWYRPADFRPPVR